MSKIIDPIDCLGNPIGVDGFVTVHFNTVPIFKVIAVERGGLHTANGITPAVVRVICDMTLRQMPGIPFTSLARLISPEAQTLIEGISDSLPKT